ncbi:von Willebrand factor A domain containing 2 [Nothobranchius furzeri]|uniref:von Willebrand factor A domain containing 2 n=1 Tax=Nothobranchius furzeri TaxID=105023 RepID=A0A9D2XLL2_NOTFU|nr:von Willebrand factor A domain containing 2 [Nothobranchius furzeri]
MCPGTCATLVLTLLLLQVQQGKPVQEIKTSHDNIMKINTAAENDISFNLHEMSKLQLIHTCVDSIKTWMAGSFLQLNEDKTEILICAPEKLVRVGLIQFGSGPQLEFSLNSYSTRQELKKQIKRISYRGGSTQTGLALKYILRKGFLGGRNSSVPHIVILLSDGRSQGNVVQAAAQLKETGVILFAIGLRYPKWEELHAVASEPVESHVFFAEDFHDAINGLYTTLSTFSVCSAAPAGCQVESFPCERKTLETVKELQGNFMCWKGSKGYSPYTYLCPYYRQVKVYRSHLSVCHRTICTEPCDSQPCLNGGMCVSEGSEGYRCVCPPGYGGDPHCAPALSLDCSVDLLFLLEGSASLTLEDFLRLKSFLKRFLQTVIGSDSPSKVGLAVFGGETRVEAQVGKFNGNLKGFLKALDALKPPGGQTLTGHALQYVTRNGFVSQPVFADVSDDLPRVVVLLTATPAADDVVKASKYARDREIFLIGVGPDGLKEQLNSITGNPQRTLTYTAADQLTGKIPELKAKVCSVDMQGCLGQAVDLVFALDASGGVGRENFATLKDFVRSLTVQFDINRDVAQVALVIYSRRAHTVFGLDTHDSGSATLRAVGDASYMGGVASTGSALLHIYSNILTFAKGARPGVNKAVVVFTDGSGGDDAVVPAHKIRDSGVSVFVVGIGDMQRDRLLKIAGSEHHMIAVPSYEDLKYHEDVLVQMMCTEVKKPVNMCTPILSGGSFRCQCKGYEGPHCETRSDRSSSRGDLPKPTGLRKSHQELPRHYKLHRRRPVA